jgi:hypothetical protein
MASQSGQLPGRRFRRLPRHHVRRVPDLINWTVINGIDNPIASVNTITATDPVTQHQVTSPANTPVIGATQTWFGGRVYNPNAMMATSGMIDPIFAGYDAAYSADIGDYRTIGQVQLSASGATIQ